MERVPHDISFGGFFLSPILVIGLFGVLAALLTARLLDHYRLSRYFANPPVVIISLSIIYAVFIGAVFVGI
ncbi:DUF1656 domain-containing protein [Microbulbifer okhotskensis]|uniref:DUF1656 domain-containing protein n=1 Tax=Microbulbifer okhotskensis TaxID=2926617 RepID=UPI00359C13E7